MCGAAEKIKRRGEQTDNSADKEHLMQRILLHTPEGVRDIYGDEYQKKTQIEEKINRCLFSYGYRGISTPTFEFFDVFGKERGSVPSKNLYKFFDREGNTLVLRPDMTPAIARAASKYYSDVNVPIKLCYCGNTYINNSELQGKLKECTQVGGELIGDGSVDADAEVISIVIDSMLSAGLNDFQVEIGNVEFFNGVLEDAVLTDEDAGNLKRLIEAKNNFGVESMLQETGVDPCVRDVLLSLPQLFGSAKVLEEARKLTKNRRAIGALDRLCELFDILNECGYARYISFDLGVLSNFEYYTGIIFKTYTYGTGDAVVTGGRYDNLLSQFGKDAPAVGFGIYLDQLLLALERQGVRESAGRSGTMIIYDRAHRTQALGLAGEIRQSGKSANLVPIDDGTDDAEYVSAAKRDGFDEVVFLR